MKLTAYLRPTQRWRTLVLIGCVFFSLMPYGLSWDYTGASNLTMDGSPLIKIEWGSLFLLASLSLFLQAEHSVRKIRSLNPALLAVLFWCLLSAFWSPYPEVTAKRAIQLFGLVAIGLMLSEHAHASGKALLTTLSNCLLLILGISLLLALVRPDIAIDHELHGAWRGALSQKNELGQTAALSILFLQARYALRAIRPSHFLWALLLSAFLLVMSKSSTSLIITLLTSILFHALNSRVIGSDLYVSRTLAGFLCIAVLPVFLFYMAESRLPTWGEITGPIAALFGKGSDLTGRTDIWDLVWMEIDKHPWQGLGYAAFWMGPDSLSQYIIDALHWIPLQSHNGYLDIINEQGYIGLGLCVATFIIHAISLVRLRRSERTFSALWTAMFLIFLITNFSESGLFRGFGFQNVLLIMSLVHTRALAFAENADSTQ